MKIKNLLLASLILCMASVAFCQTKMLYGPKHLVLVNMPQGWYQTPFQGVPLFMKPDKKKVSNTTYMYVLGLDYAIDPDMEEWIQGNSDELLGRVPDVKIGSMDLQFDNLKASEKLTGRYRTITYTYPNKRTETLLVIECKNTILTVSLSAKNQKEMQELLPGFVSLVQSMQVMNATVKEE